MYSKLSKIKSKIYIFNSGCLSSGHYTYVSKDVRIRGYFSKPKEAREQTSLETTGLDVS
jgi:hypothetical protein